MYLEKKYINLKFNAKIYIYHFDLHMQSYELLKLEERVASACLRGAGVRHGLWPASGGL